MTASLHLCPIDDRWTYLPALDPEARDVPGGALVRAPLSFGSIPAFDYKPSRDGLCWICAYADALRTKRAEAPEVEEAVLSEEDLKLRARARLRGLAGVAKSALGRVDSERRVQQDAEAPRYVSVAPDACLIYTARIDSRDPHRLDVTRKSAGPDGIAFAPSWALLRRTLVKLAGGSALPWEEYARAYAMEMDASRRENAEAWAALLRRPRVVLVCYCVDAHHCHRTLLAREILPRLDPRARYLGEIGKEEERQILGDAPSTPTTEVDAPPTEAPARQKSFEELIAASSLGTPEVVAIRAQADPALVERVLARADEIAREAREAASPADPAPTAGPPPIAGPPSIADPPPAKKGRRKKVKPGDGGGGQQSLF